MNVGSGEIGVDRIKVDDTRVLEERNLLQLPI